jgi:HK97 family phage portal protein
VQQLTGTAFACLDLNSGALSTMPPYLVGAAPSLNTEWLTNPNPTVYNSWQEFARRMFYDWQAIGEVFVHADSYYATGWPATFHILPPWSVNVEMRDGLRHYTIGARDITGRVLHLRYLSSVDDAHGHGPLEAGAGRLIAAEVYARYATSLAASGGVPPSVLEHPEELTAEQSALLKAQWVEARQSSIGEPAVLSGGLKWTPTQVNARDMGLHELQQFNEAAIAVLLGVPPHLVGIPTGDSMTYANVNSIFDYHWRSSLRVHAHAVMLALSGWLLPRGTRVELNRDEYIQPGPYERAQTAQILNGIVDERGNPALTVDEIREAERLNNTVAEGVLT